MYNCYRGKDCNYDDHDHSRMAEHLLEAEAIKSDKKVMAKVHKHLKNKSKQISSIAQLRAKANTSYDEA